jgi:hypothetical protein
MPPTSKDLSKATPDFIPELHLIFSKATPDIFPELHLNDFQRNTNN